MDKVCACGTPISPRSQRCRPCGKRLRQARYRRTAKGKATRLKYNHGPSRQKTQARYRHSSVGKQTIALHNDKRIFVGRTYHGRAHSVAHATAIRSHIKERVSAFITRQQTGAETESATPCAVPPQAKP